MHGLRTLRKLNDEAAEATRILNARDPGRKNFSAPLPEPEKPAAATVPTTPPDEENSGNH